MVLVGVGDESLSNFELAEQKADFLGNIRRPGVNEQAVQIVDPGPIEDLSQESSSHAEEANIAVVVRSNHVSKLT